jgi:hypothetical protein
MGTEFVRDFSATSEVEDEDVIRRPEVVAALDNVSMRSLGGFEIQRTPFWATDWVTVATKAGRSRKPTKSEDVRWM